MNPEEPLVLYDGQCGLCQRSVRFLLRHEKAPVLKFASLQSDFGQSLLKKHDLKTDLSEMVLIENGEVKTGPEGALQSCRYLKAPARWLAVGRVLPPPLRRGLYRFVARRRYRWFGKSDVCALPAPEQSDRFLG
ncbi:MAG: DUF393 domain-containing protein [Verrucomicrobia bacterium]|nr:DUF393 domain-containing protein [Verrucomicrobiota bacterium]MCH8511965.1 DCC1-like thiol-disulfide oxidoreductase family protein [Kiritimatiellia bacterium]